MAAHGDDSSALSAAHDRDSDQRLDRLYREQASRLQRRVGARIRSADDASDLVHDAFARLLGSASLRELRKPEAFLNRIVRNLLIDRARRLAHKAIHVPIEGADEPATPPAQADAVEIAELREQYRAAVASLPDRMRSVFILHRIEGFNGLRAAGLLSARAVSRQCAPNSVVRLGRRHSRKPPFVHAMVWRLLLVVSSRSACGFGMGESRHSPRITTVPL